MPALRVWEGQERTTSGRLRVTTSSWCAVVAGLLDTRERGKEDVVLWPSEVALPQGERVVQVACSGALTVLLTGEEDASLRKTCITR